MDANIFIMVSDDNSHLEVDGHIDLFAKLLATLHGCVGFDNIALSPGTKQLPKETVAIQEGAQND